MQVTPSHRTAGLVTTDERQQIIDLYSKGTKVAEICRMTGRCRSSVYKVLNDAGAEHRNAAPGEALRADCEVCGGRVRYVTPTQRASGLGRFCSAKCMGEAKRLAPRNADYDLPCTRCGESKPASEFYSHATTRRGYQYWCKDCCAQDRLERASAPQDPKLTRRYKLKLAYGITQEDYDVMYDRQNGCCAICGNAKERWEPGAGLKGRQRFLVVDHDHQTSRVRALLCWNCNCGLGHFRENPAIMQAAIEYMRAHEALMENMRPVLAAIR